MKKTVALFVFLACLLRLSATVIVFQPANNYIGTAGGYLFVDINNDGFDDFRINAYTGWPSDHVSIEALSTGSMMLTDGAGKTRGLNDNILIGSNFPSNIWETTSDTYIWGQVFPFPLDVYTSIPVQININGNTHYGYIYVFVGSSSGFTHLNLFRVAYEDIPGQSIRSGAYISTDVAEQVKPDLSLSVVGGLLNVSIGNHYRGNFGMFAIDGRRVFETDFSSDHLQIPVSSYAAGIYLLRIEVATPRGPVVVTRKVRLS